MYMYSIWFRANICVSMYVLNKSESYPMMLPMWGRNTANTTQIPTRTTFRPSTCFKLKKKHEIGGAS